MDSAQAAQLSLVVRGYTPWPGSDRHKGVVGAHGDFVQYWPLGQSNRQLAAPFYRSLL